MMQVFKEIVGFDDSKHASDVFGEHRSGKLDKQQAVTARKTWICFCYLWGGLKYSFPMFLPEMPHEEHVKKEH